ncbi:uncharacterized protein [Littorina saxatilis]|uniref:uncharacterized protein isoform X3 n=1 Tax=Littorina saxatilis TaxID=31220 RepID=UPI0038B6046D
MKTMNNRKRVSFGSKGSMVETWIIEDLPTPRSNKEEEFISSFVTHSKSDPGLHGLSTPLPTATTTTTTSSETKTTATGLPPWGLSSPLRDAKNRVLLLSDPQGLSPRGLEGRNGTFYLTDRVTGWPLKRTASLESRDNPFLPGGDLSKEAEELLKKATIVRDKFYLNQEGKYVQHSSPEHYDPSKAHHPTGDTSYDAADGTLLANANNNNAAAAAAAVLEERISPSSASKAQAGIAPAPGEAVPRVNGKAGDGVVGGTSPDGVRLEVGGSPTADGSRGVGNDNAGAAPGVGGDQQDKDKAKRRPKCCTVM